MLLLTHSNSQCCAACSALCASGHVGASRDAGFTPKAMVGVTVSLSGMDVTCMRADMPTFSFQPTSNAQPAPSPPGC